MARGGRVLITGGAGFIGSNLADRVASDGCRVTVMDTLARPGVERNLNWLLSRHRDRVRHLHADIRDEAEAARAVAEADVVFHLAAQVAVTTSLVDPREDFEINALGTFNMLEATRKQSPESFFITASTNKVYGKMHNVEVVERNGRYEYKDLVGGVTEDQQLDFHSPYGCSKGVADQYTIDYSRIYGLRSVALRQS